VSHPITQLCPQLAHVASCGWWKGDGGSMCHAPNSPHGQVVDKIV